MNNKGFVMVSYLTFSMVVLGAGMATTLLWWTLSQFQWGQKICIEKSVDSQKQIAPLFDRLFSLNGEAQPLIDQKRKLLAELAVATASGNAPWIAKVMTKLKSVIARQSLVRAKQQAIFTESKIAKWHWSWGIKNEFRKHRIQGQEIQGLPFSVEMKSWDEIAPTYKLKMDFEKQQTSAFEYKIPWTVSHIPIASSYWQKQTVMSGTCKVSLSKKGNLWKAKLIAAK